MSCVIVGNGSTVLESHHGAEIDRFDQVVRFNQYHIKKFESHVGTKVTHWFTVIPTVNATWRATQPLHKLYVHSWVREPERDSLLRQYEKLRLPCPVEKVDHDLIREMQQAIGTDYYGWSTGALAIWLMLKTQPEVSITGFDWWDREKHHYFDQAARGHLHKPQIEKQLIDKLIEQDRLKFL